MKAKLLFLLIALFIAFPIAAADDVSKTEWIDITKEVAANPAEKGGWTIDKAGKIFRSEDGNSILIEHSEYGKFIIDLKNGVVNKVQNDNPLVQKDSTLINREGGTMLVVRTQEYKFRLRFTEKVSGMKAVEGIKEMM
ncbi:MAG: hypothetical protein WBM02_02055 [bacterium]